MAIHEDTERPLRVLLLCPGLDHAQRGFESFARDCFEAVRDAPGLDIQLIKGSGPRAPNERSIPTLRRDTALAQILARVTGLTGFVIEHLSFSVCLIPLLIHRRPDVVYFSEWHVGRALALWRRVARQRFRLVMCNGSSSPGPYGHLDLVQHLTPGALRFVLDRGADPAKNFLLPLGFHISERYAPPSPNEREALRRRFGLPTDRRIVISVAAINRQKRIDYLIEEVASMPAPKPFVLVVGQSEDETPALRELAARRLGPDGYSMRTVSRDDVDGLLRASDVFVLASLWEGLPRALIEAMAQGLPCVGHAYPVMDYALGGHGYTGDFASSGALVRLLAEVGESAVAPSREIERHNSVYERFSWNALRSQYVNLLRGRPPDGRANVPR